MHEVEGVASYRCAPIVPKQQAHATHVLPSSNLENQSIRFCTLYIHGPINRIRTTNDVSFSLSIHVQSQDYRIHTSKRKEHLIANLGHRNRAPYRTSLVLVMKMPDSRYWKSQTDSPTAHLSAFFVSPKSSLEIY